MLTRLLRSDRGVSLTELAVALFVSSIVLTGAVTWATASLRTDRANRNATATVDELRFAKSQLMRELRFASDVYVPSGDDYVEFWLDDGDGVLTAGIGEVVKYEIQTDGTFLRTTDDPSGPSKLIATGMRPLESSFVVTANTVDIVLTIDFDPTDSYRARSLETTITARNN